MAVKTGGMSVPAKELEARDVIVTQFNAEARGDYSYSQFSVVPGVGQVEKTLGVIYAAAADYNMEDAINSLQEQAARKGANVVAGVTCYPRSLPDSEPKRPHAGLYPMLLGTALKVR